MLFYLSDLALKDYAQYTVIAQECLSKFSNLFTSLEDLIHHKITNIKRLKYYQPTVWRYRHDNFRLVFTVTSQSQEIVLVHRFLPRDIVYKKLPQYLTDKISTQDTQTLDIQPNHEYQLHNRYFSLPLKQLNQPEQITEYITKGNYLFSPCLTEEQLQFVGNINTYKFKIYQIQGAAGTGKTTLAFQIAIETLKQHQSYPLIIVPTESLQRFGIKIIENKAEELKREINICTNLIDREISDLAIVTVENFFKFASGDKHDCLTKFEANQIINKYINRQNSKHLHGIDLYNLHLGLRQNESYIQTTHGHIFQSYQMALDELNNYYDKKNLALAFDFNHRDTISQAKRAFNNKNKILDKIKNISQNQPIVFIIDEVQDLYWQQIKLLLFLAKNQENPQPFVMLGDVNQEITISGFSWANFDQSYLNEFIKNEEIDDTQTRNILNQHRENHGQDQPLKNFRNTIKIASAARFILIDAFRNHLNNNGRHILDPGKPEEHCFEKGIAPLLVKANQVWLTNFIEKLIKETPPTENSKFVFIVNQDSEHYSKIKLKIDQYKKQILSLTIVQAKGQEFDAVVYVSLFAFQKAQPSIHEIYKWYTALTRSRYFSVILLLENEYNWLTTQIDKAKIKLHFNILENPNLDDLIKQVSEQGVNIVTTQQILQKVALNYGESWSFWLQGQIISYNLREECQEENISFWELINYLENNAQEIVNLNYENISDNQLKKLSDNMEIFDCFACLIMIFKIAKDNEILQILSGKLFHKLKKYFKQNLQELENALQEVETPIAKILLLRYSHRSYEAANFAYKNGYDFLIEDILKDLETQKLLYEAARIKYQYLNIKPNHDFPYPQLLEKKGDLVNLIIDEFLAQLPAHRLT
jgi:mRNA-degrading endonuclease RelE of RelBE toxin-antitoxin system